MPFIAPIMVWALVVIGKVTTSPIVIWLAEKILPEAIAKVVTERLKAYHERKAKAMALRAAQPRVKG